ncbi:hypothetical protein VTJ83DRAFT_2967 [Remersonia thermophila]|uniref:Swiss Army Knife RNA repair protein HAD domain-containing protein n=1 Tax=Remersonia thermophila TaxID=72144 RepID=A0ABR4DCP4_9PEZI
MGPTAYAAYKNGTAFNAHTITTMGRWSILNKQLPPVDSVKAIHVYDFDNTLFKTPLPNPKLWNNTTIGTLSNPDAFVNGGWWHDSRILAATGEGLAKEEPRAWEGWWNEKIVELIRLTNKQKDALCVLLTGRSESGFGDLIKRMVASKGLEFDMISLKPVVGPSNETFQNTMHFKQVFLEALMETYRHADEIRIYEDRIKHVKGFRDFLDEYNAKKINGVGGAGARGPIKGDVIQVLDVATYLDPVVEIAEVQQLINDHNASLSKGRRRPGVRAERLAIKKTVFYTGYMIKHADAQRLLTLAQTPPNLAEGEVKFHANNIMICPRPASPTIMDKIGGLGGKMTWEVSGTACHDGNLWAARVRPVPDSAPFHTSDPVPLVVLALRKGARHVDAAKIQQWQPVAPEQAFRFETTIGEKILLRIEPEDLQPSADHAGGQHQQQHQQHQHATPRAGKRKHTAHQDDFRSRPSGPAQQQHRHFHQAAGGRGGGAAAGRGGFRGANGAGGSGVGAGVANAAGGNRNFGKGPRGGGIAKSRGGGGGGGGPGSSRGGGHHHHHHHHHNHHYKSLDDVGGRDTQGGFASMYEDGEQPQQQQQQQQRGGNGLPQNVPTGPSNPSNPGYYPGYQHQPSFGRPGLGPGGGAGAGASAAAAAGGEAGLDQYY